MSTGKKLGRVHKKWVKKGAAGTQKIGVDKSRDRGYDKSETKSRKRRKCP